MECRLCKSKNLEMFLDLGYIPLVDRFLDKDELTKPETLYPLQVYLCKNCGLSQLGYIVPAKDLFNENYAYESTGTKGRYENYLELANYICEKFNIPKNSFVVDIGSNVGLLLSFFKKNNMQVLGIDASSNVAKLANSKQIETICGFFNDEMVQKILTEKQNADVITATNVFAHIQNYESFILSLKRLLSEDGIFVFQVPHFYQLLKNFEYDTIYHEHISYFGLKPLIQFFSKYDLEIFDVFETDIDGGAIRCFVGKKDRRSISPNIQQMLKIEEDEKIYSIERLQGFSDEVKKQKQNLRKLLIQLRENNRIVGIGAPAKGMTLLNYCKIDADILSYITEKSSLKIGKFTPGMHIPVEKDEKLIDDRPEYALILAWNFGDEIMNNLKEYSQKGGKFIIPIPFPRIV